MIIRNGMDRLMAGYRFRFAGMHKPFRTLPRNDKNPPNRFDVYLNEEMMVAAQVTYFFCYGHIKINFYKVPGEDFDRRMIQKKYERIASIEVPVRTRELSDLLAGIAGNPRNI